MIQRITKTYIRTYSDTGQRVAYVEWLDHRGRPGRTEGPAEDLRHVGTHMAALFSRAAREGAKAFREVW